MDYGLMLRLFPLALAFIGVVAALVIGIMIYIKRFNDRQPILTITATVMSKDIENDEIRFSASDTSPGPRYFHHKFYHITFQTGDGAERRFFVSKNEYARLAEGDRGDLTFQGGRYLGFRKV